MVPQQDILVGCVLAVCQRGAAVHRPHPTPACGQGEGRKRARLGIAEDY